MAKHTAKTDASTTIKLASSIQQVLWTKPIAAAGGMVGLEIYTRYVGNNSDIQVVLTDGSGKTLGNYKESISGNKLWANIRVPANAKDALFATAKLPKHGLSMKSNALIVIPPIEIKNLKWSQKEARRGDIVKMTADVKGVPDGTDAEISIWEHDADKAHDLITKFKSQVKNGKIEAEWEYEYHEDTDEIPIENEVKKYGKHYNPPEYFFRITIYGVRADSGLLVFKDWIELVLEDKYGDPMPGEKFVVHFADGTQKQGTLDSDAQARIDQVPPGPVKVEYPDVADTQLEIEGQGVHLE